jgi:hypothetical protein
VNAYFYSLIALDIARERSREAEESWLAASIVREASTAPSGIRRPMARLLAAVSRSSASAAGRLDTRVADDLRRTLALAD